VPWRLFAKALSLWAAERYLFLADLIADQATDRCAADRTDRAAARKDSTRNGTGSGANRRILVARRHPAATSRTENRCYRNRTDCQSLDRFHWTAFSRTTLSCNS
jgi:hypothetical protein